MKRPANTTFAVFLASLISHVPAAAQERPLFPQPLFPDFSMDAGVQGATGSPAVVVPVATRTAADVDNEMRRQMRSVARYLELYGIRNGSRFPGFQDEEMQAARVQLMELVPNNPYGSSPWGEQWSEQQDSQEIDRIRLQMNLSLSTSVIDNWTTNPPSDWTAPPGTITAIGNNQGLYIVWGAGQDGKPIRNPSSGRTLIITGTTSGTVNDQSAPNPGT
jgi:hypothetical protein